MTEPDHIDEALDEMARRMANAFTAAIDDVLEEPQRSELMAAVAARMREIAAETRREFGG